MVEFEIFGIYCNLPEISNELPKLLHIPELSNYVLEILFGKIVHFLTRNNFNIKKIRKGVSGLIFGVVT